MAGPDRVGGAATGGFVTYSLGVDLGTTFSTVAVLRGERVEMVDLGGRGFAVPSVVFVGPDGTVLVGEAAQRRAASDPTLVVREIKRRLGDTAPVLIGDTPYSPALLTAALLRGVLGQVVQAEGATPERVMLTHPANWGSFRRDIFAEAAALSGLGATFELITEPVAAALWHARHERIPIGMVIAVYDLGGGTFDAAVLRKDVDGFEVLGQPAGLDRLGGVDFDEALIAFVDRCLSGALRGLDPALETSARIMRSVRQEVVAAKETLSTDVAATINVALPTGLEAVRITRREFEGMIEPFVGESIMVMRAALDGAGVSPAEVDKVLLVGGSSRVPLIFELIERELGLRAALDDHPKNVVAMGAAAALARPGSTSANAATPPANAAASPATVFGSPVAVAPSDSEQTEPAQQVAQARATGGEQESDLGVFGDPGVDLPVGVTLVVATGPDGGAVRPIGSDHEVELGRDSDAATDWALYDPRVSRRHANLRSDGQALWVQDLGSLNHSFIDGQPVDAAWAHPGQAVRFGNTVALVLRRQTQPDVAPAQWNPPAPFALPVAERSGARLLRNRPDTDKYGAQLEALRPAIELRVAQVAAMRRLRHRVAGLRFVHPVPALRGGAEGFLAVTVGFADAPSELTFKLPEGLARPLQTQAEDFAASFVDREVPVVVELSGLERLVLDGPVEAVAGTLRQLLAQVVLHHDPADVAVAVLTDTEAEDSDFAVSLGRGVSLGVSRTTLGSHAHLRSANGQELLGGAGRLAELLGRMPARRHIILLGMDPTVEGIRLRLAGTGAGHRVTCVVPVATPTSSSSRPDALTEVVGPGEVYLRISAEDGSAQIEGLGAPGVIGPLLPASVNATNAEVLLGRPPPPPGRPS